MCTPRVTLTGNPNPPIQTSEPFRAVLIPLDPLTGCPKLCGQDLEAADEVPDAEQAAVGFSKGLGFGV